MRKYIGWIPLVSLVITAYKIINCKHFLIYLKINGIDRVDSNIGYTKDNSVPCCKYCNFAKHTMSEDDFYVWVKRVYEYNFK